MAGVAQAANNRNRKPNYTILLIVVYLWALIATPQYRFDLLATLQYEKIIVGLAWLTLLLSGRFQPRFTKTSGLLLVFYLWMLLSYFASPYPDTWNAQWWLTTYWKLLVFYFLVLFSVQDVDDLHVLLAGVVVVSGLYQLHSWMDFIQGGAYVYQQGVRRIVGVWSPTGLGAPNHFALMALFALPFGVAWYRLAQSRLLRLGLIGFVVMCCASILFSGTRGALFGLAFYVIARYAHRLLRPVPIMAVALSGAVALAVLPQSLTSRYLSVFVEDASQVPAEELAEASAQSRIEGLKDGWRLALERPLLGWGPGSSPVARSEVRPQDSEVTWEDEAVLQLHSLYGQVMGETGFVGTFLAMWIVLHSLFQLRRLRREASGAAAEWASALFLALLIYMFYGFASHTLYRFNWLLLFAAQAALTDICRRVHVPERVPAWAQRAVRS